MAGTVLSWCNDHAVLLACVGIGSYTLWTSVQPVVKWKLRSVPGSWGWPLLGELPTLLTKDHTEVAEEGCMQYKDKPAYQLWVMSSINAIIPDVELGRRMLMRYNSRQDLDFLTLRYGEDRAIWNSGLLFIAGHKWRVARKAFEGAVMHPRALVAQAPFVCKVLSRSIVRLDGLADSGQPVDMLAAMYDCSIDAIGWAAFGIDLQATSRSPSSSGVAYEEGWWTKYPVGSQEFGALMLQCAMTVMKSMDMAEASPYTLLAFMLPGLAPMLRQLARLLPDARLKHQTKMFRGLRESIKVLVDTWRAQQRQPLQASSAVKATSSSEPATRNGDVDVAAKVSNEGFLARLLSGRDLAAGEKLEDYEVIGNAMMMVVTGYETTGTAMANTLYLLARHPEAQHKAQAELDAVLQGKAPSLDDLERLPYLTAAFDETLRLQPAAAAASREVTSAVDLGQGVTLPKGTAVLFPTRHYMRDPAIWPRPLEFLPERHIQPGNEALAPSNPHAFMPFGHGARMCVGYKYAQMEARLALAHLLQRFSFELVLGAPEPVWRTSLAFSPQSLPLIVKRRVQH